MKQLINYFIPDKATGWKLAAMILLFLLGAVLIVNSLAALAEGFFPDRTLAQNGAADQHTMLTEDAVSVNQVGDDRAVQNLQSRVDEANATIDELREEIALKEAELLELVNQKDVAEGEVAALREQTELLHLEIEALILERDALSAELEAVKAANAKDFTLVVKVVRAGFFGNEAMFVNLHVSAEEYAAYHIGDQVQPGGDLVLPEEGDWSAVVSDMYINLIEV